MESMAKLSFLHTLARAKAATFRGRDAASADILSTQRARLITPQSNKRQRESLLTLGRGDHLMSQSALRSLAHDGWTKSDPTSLWTDSTRSTLRFRSDDASERPSIATLRFRAFLNADKAQSISLFAASQELAKVSFGPDSERQSVRVAIPFNAYSADDVFELTIKVHMAVSPKELGLGDDGRTLGVALLGLQLS